jgi:hypothetical protein
MIINYLLSLLQPKHKDVSEHQKYLDILHSDGLYIDKCMGVSDLLNGIVVENVSYATMRERYIISYVENLASLITSLKTHHSSLLATGNCNISPACDSVEYRLDVWVMDDIALYGYIGIIEGWKIALWYITEISSLTKTKIHRNYVSRSLYKELDTFLSLTEFLIREVLK